MRLGKAGSPDVTHRAAGVSGTIWKFSPTDEVALVIPTLLRKSYTINCFRSGRDPSIQNQSFQSLESRFAVRRMACNRSGKHSSEAQLISNQSSYFGSLLAWYYRPKRNLNRLLYGFHRRTEDL